MYTGMYRSTLLWQIFDISLSEPTERTLPRQRALANGLENYAIHTPGNINIIFERGYFRNAKLAALILHDITGPNSGDS